MNNIYLRWKKEIFQHKNSYQFYGNGSLTSQLIFGLWDKIRIIQLVWEQLPNWKTDKRISLHFIPKLTINHYWTVKEWFIGYKFKHFLTCVPFIKLLAFLPRTNVGITRIWFHLKQMIFLVIIFSLHWHK